jgi:hypothetical protein
MACDTVIQLLYNDGCTAASSPYPLLQAERQKEGQERVAPTRIKVL